MPLTHHVSDLVLSARSQIDQASVHDALRMQEQGEAQLIDIRDVGELKQNGTVTGSYHAPRSMLEFWVDPLTPTTRSFSAPTASLSCSARQACCPRSPPRR